MKIALIQNQVSRSKEVNCEKTQRKIREAAQQGAEIICLQELFTTPYFCQTEDPHNFSAAEYIPGATTSFLMELSREQQIVIIGGSVFEKENERYFNTSIVAETDGSLLGKYRKVHIPHDLGYSEKFYFTPGDAYKTFRTSKGNLGVLICYDQWFPEAARATMLEGMRQGNRASILFYPTAVGWTEAMRKLEPWSRQRWERDQCAHASANEVYVAAVNRVGIEGKIEFWGSSFVADPFGEVIARASSDKEEILIADLDERKIETAKGWYLMQNRRPETYRGLSQ